MFLGNILVPGAVLLMSMLWFALRKKADFHTLVFGLLTLSTLNAFIAASVPAMTNIYYLPLGGGTINQFLLFVLVDLLFFICSIIYLAGSFISAWKEKSPEHRYRNENLFFFRQIISKLNTTSKTMTMISITLVLAILMLLPLPFW